MAVSYDLHIHSCLSPCGDDAMTPPNIANMAALLGMDLIAVTDHNSCRNAGAVMAAAEMLGLPLTVLAGMEVTTAEEVHVVCLFPDLASAQAAGEEVEAALMTVKNKPEIFGRQMILGPEEEFLGEFEPLLINATSLSIDDMPGFARRYGGMAFPAHIDRSSNSVFANLGYFPDYLDFPIAEVWRPEVFFRDGGHREVREGRMILKDSDAHRLEDMKEGGACPWPEKPVETVEEFLGVLFNRSRPAGP